MPCGGCTALYGIYSIIKIAWFDFLNIKVGIIWYSTDNVFDKVYLCTSPARICYRNRVLSHSQT